MCVIISMEKEIPSLETFKLCEEKNRDGGGISWVENGKVHFKKGIEYKEMHDIAKTKGAPCVAHFRISTIGGKPKELCHPFIVDPKSSIALEGKTDAVLFHNGVWNNWESKCINMVLNKGAKFSGGAWSDSRAMAWLAGNSNHSFLALIGQKVVIQTPRSRFYYGNFENKGGVWYSNLYWEKQKEYSYDTKYDYRYARWDIKSQNWYYPTDKELAETEAKAKNKKDNKDNKDDKAVTVVNPLDKVMTEEEKTEALLKFEEMQHKVEDGGCY